MKKLSPKTVLQLRRAFYVLGLFTVGLALTAAGLSRSQSCTSHAGTPEKSSLLNSSVYDDPNQLSVLLYNTQLRPRMLFSSGQSDRTKKIIPLLANYDIVILSEVFDDQALRELKSLHTYKSVSDPLGQNEGLYQDSGLVIFSQSDITAQRQIVFEGDCEGTSCFNYQGAIAIQLTKSELLKQNPQAPTYHLITAQMQAGDSPKAAEIRADQYQQIRQLIDNLTIPSDEPIIFAASLPISPQTHPAEFTQMQEAIGLTIINSNHPQTYSPSSTQNQPAIPQPSQPADALFIVTQGVDAAVPTESRIQSVGSQVRPMQTSPQQGWKSASWFYWQCRQQNLSDHYATEGLFNIKKSTEISD